MELWTPENAGSLFLSKFVEGRELQNTCRKVVDRETATSTQEVKEKARS